MHTQHEERHVEQTRSIHISNQHCYLLGAARPVWLLGFFGGYLTSIADENCIVPNGTDKIEEQLYLLSNVYRLNTSIYLLLIEGVRTLVAAKVVGIVKVDSYSVVDRIESSLA